MRVFFAAMVIISTVIVCTGYGQDVPRLFEGRMSLTSVAAKSATPEFGIFAQFAPKDGSRAARANRIPALFPANDLSRVDLSRFQPTYDFTSTIIRGQSAEAGGGGAASAGGASVAAATDPSAILTQFQIQNVFTPETYNASGYSNTLILQPVLPFPVAMPGLKEFFPNHIIRPTLPIISPTADPDGPFGVEGGLGDLALIDAFIHPVEGFGDVIFGYTAMLPTATDAQLGLREWQLGPAAGLVYKEIPKTLLGFIYQQPFSLESQAQQIVLQPVLIRNLSDNRYVGWGDLNWIFNTDNGDYNIPLSVRFGKVCMVGQQPINIFVQPFYTPEGLRQGPASEWGVKLNVTFLFPGAKFGPLSGSLFGRRCH
jgi:hypothetical protein